MKLNEINIRDPYVLLVDNTYYMYGSRAKNCWGIDDGLDCYYSTDLEEWTGPVEVFHKPEGFWADRNYWAPECHIYQGAYYIFVSLKSEDQCRGTQILRADYPLGPFRVHSEKPVTPAKWECLDGTFYISEEGVPYMVFCHEWTQIQNGTICAVELTKDLKEPAGKPQVLFEASEASWVSPVRIQLQEVKTGVVTDGPFLYRCKNGELLMIWSSFGENGYAEGVSRSKNGNILGPWSHDESPLFKDNGGHGMVFTSKEGKKYLVLHAPNETPLERPVFYELEERDGRLYMK